MPFPQYNPTEADKMHSRLMELIDDLAANMATKIDNLKALLNERELEIQELEAKLAEARKQII